MTRDDGSTAARSYDSLGPVTQLVNAESDGAAISSFDCAYDAAGNPAVMVEANGDRVTWAYGALGQLTREQRSGDNAYDITYTYDPVGDRLTKLAADATTTYTYDAANELVTEALAWPLRPCEMPLVDLMARHRTHASLKCDIKHTFEAGGRGEKGEDTIE